MNYIDKITQQQKFIGYSEGKINIIASLGLYGEIGEVIDEYKKIIRDNKINYTDFDIEVSDVIYYINAIGICRNKNYFLEGISLQKEDTFLNVLFKLGSTVGKYFSEIELGANTNYEVIDDYILYIVRYINKLILLRNKSFDYFVELSYNKIINKKSKNISHGLIYDKQE